MAAICNNNLLLAVDSYKVSHHLQYPPGTTCVYSYFESRGGKFSETVFFGLQYIIKRWLTGRVVTREKIEEAAAIFAKHIPSHNVFNREGWEYVLERYDGHLPLRIAAVPEGTVVDVKNVLLTVENTDPKCFWLSCYVETLLVQVWYPMSAASNSREFKKVIKAYLAATSDDTNGLPFKLQDFGCRGVSSMETASIGGAAHLVNFMGTDTVPALTLIRDYYQTDVCGFSIPASEHSTITSWGREHEVDAMRNMLEQFPDGLVACVSDSFDIWNACTKLWGEELKDAVVSRGERNGTLVVRPDSGDPAKVVLECLNRLGEAFGYTLNTKGYKVLPSYVRLIQGDGVSLESVQSILMLLAENGWSAENLAFGSGGALLQKLNRDTQRCAFKCSEVIVHGESREVFKDPITDQGKASKRGRLTLEKDNNGRWVTQERGTGDPAKDMLVVVFENGVLLREYTFTEVRANAELGDVPVPDLPTPKEAEYRRVMRL